MLLPAIRRHNESDPVMSDFRKLIAARHRSGVVSLREIMKSGLSVVLMLSVGAFTLLSFVTGVEAGNNRPNYAHIGKPMVKRHRASQTRHYRKTGRHHRASRTQRRSIYFRSGTHQGQRTRHRVPRSYYAGFNGSRYNRSRYNGPRVINVRQALSSKRIRIINRTTRQNENHLTRHVINDGSGQPRVVYYDDRKCDGGYDCVLRFGNVASSPKIIVVGKNRKVQSSGPQIIHPPLDD